jgi:hypothetical protein
MYKGWHSGIFVYKKPDYAYERSQMSWQNIYWYVLALASLLLLFTSLECLNGSTRTGQIPMRNLLFTGVALAALTAIVSPANASLIFDLTQDNVGGIGPYAQVTVNRTTQSTATITFDQLGQYYLMDGGSAALNIDGSYTLGSITGLAATGATQATYTSGGAGNEDGYGSFNFTVNSSDGWASRSSEIIITLTGGNWDNDAAVLTGNSHNALAAAHIGFDGGGTTGFAAGGTGTVIPAPEPASLVVLGIGLLGLGVARRRPHAA